MADVTLFTPGRIDGFDTRNRLVMAPMTRSRALPGGVPSELAIEYYVQRATAGLIITEGVAPCAAGLGYARTPTAETPEQMAAWKKIADAVHAKGGRMFMQFMHVGRIGNAENRYTKEPLVAPSAVRAAGQMWTDTKQMQDLDMPRALETSEIPGVIAQYAAATRNALDAGFDGVELHSASGYLPMQFLSTNTNLRTDGYGGSVQNRIRFVVEALEAMAKAAGSPSRVGIKISPAMPFNDINDADPVETYTTLVKAIGSMGLGVPARAEDDDPQHVRAAAAAVQGAVPGGWRVHEGIGQRDARVGCGRLHRVRQALHVESGSARAIREERGARRSGSEHVLLAGAQGVYGLHGALKKA